MDHFPLVGMPGVMLEIVYFLPCCLLFALSSSTSGPHGLQLQNEIIQMVKDAGFSFVDRIDLGTIGYENQFIYVFQNSK